MSLALYRQSTLGNSLFEVLQELQNEKKISETMLKKTMEVFDKSICDEISKVNKSRATIKATITSFKNCDDIWIFYGKDATVKTDKEQLTSNKLKIITCDKNMKEQLDQDKKNYSEFYNPTEENS
jgi:transcription initiation factor TFIIA small subunit